jgi:hypothetical protein
MHPVRTHKQRPEFGNPMHVGKEFPRFTPVPIPQPVNTTLPLNAVLGLTRVNAIQQAEKIVFHAVGDTGGHNGTEVEEAIAVAMEAQFGTNPQDNPSFFYHLGDVIYFNGQSEAYPTQFYEPYQYYPSIIFAIPGNHDGDTSVRPTDVPDTEPSLYGFIQNFCAAQRTPLNNAYRDTMTQPYVFWTLKAPFVTIIGLYGNVDGTLDGPGAAAQHQWLTEQLAHADKSTCIIVAVHQPPYSLDTTHCGYPYIGSAIDQAANAANVWPDAVFSGHVHNYQRFTRQVELGNGTTKDIPYIVAGAGGYANKAQRLHRIQKDANGNLPTLPFSTTVTGVQLDGFNDEDPGFLRVTITSQHLTAEYYRVPFDTQSGLKFDEVVLDHQSGRITT